MCVNGVKNINIKKRIGVRNKMAETRNKSVGINVCNTHSSVYNVITTNITIHIKSVDLPQQYC